LEVNELREHDGTVETTMPVDRGISGVLCEVRRSKYQIVQPWVGVGFHSHPLATLVEIASVEEGKLTVLAVWLWWCDAGKTATNSDSLVKMEGNAETLVGPLPHPPPPYP
jgi:hypothetical protein